MSGVVKMFVYRVFEKSDIATDIAHIPPSSQQDRTFQFRARQSRLATEEHYGSWSDASNILVFVTRSFQFPKFGPWQAEGSRQDIGLPPTFCLLLRRQPLIAGCAQLALTWLPNSDHGNAF